MGTVTSTPPETQGKSVKRDPRFMPFGMYFKPIALENGNPAHQSAWHWWAVWGGICRRLSTRRLSRTVRKMMDIAVDTSTKVRPGTVPDDWCWSHNRSEPTTETTYRVCGECSHVFETEGNLIRDHTAVLLRFHELGEGLALTDSGSDIYICPHCAHDF